MNAVVLYVAMSGIIALIFTFFLVKEIHNEEDVTPEILQTSDCIKHGSKLFLKKEYIYLLLVGVIIAVAVSLLIGIKIGISFLVGALFSMVIVYISVCIATFTNIKVAQGTKKGIKHASKIASSGGVVIGMGVVALGVLGIATIYIIFSGNVKNLAGFGLGASYISLFSRICGGIYSKSCNISSNSSLKADINIKKSLILIDNIGDNIGEIGGVSADLFESYVGAIIATITLGSSVAADLVEQAIVYPMIIVSIGIIATLVGGIFNRNIKLEKTHNSLNTGVYIAQAIVIVSSAILSKILFGDFNGFIASTSGVLAGLIISKSAEFYTSSKYKPVKNISRECELSTSNTIISGIFTGMRSTVIPIVVIILSIITSYYIMGGGDNNASGLYGISLSVIGIICTIGLTISLNGYSTIYNNASGILSITNNEITIADKLDNMENTTLSRGKIVAICSATLTSLVLFICFSQLVSLEGVNILNPITLTGVLAGATMPFLFSSLMLKSILKSANKIVNKVKETDNKIDMNYELDYKIYVNDTTSFALKETVKLAILAISSPIFIGFILGVEALGGFICGGIVTGVLLAVFMANTGCSFNDMKKHINYEKNGEDAYNSAIEAGIVGKALKDGIAPTLNTLIKLMAIMSLVIGPLIVEYGGLILGLFN